jgi:glutamyl-tRNA synthetase/glutamyl-Q tRNA(Asp) synthetase
MNRRIIEGMASPGPVRTRFAPAPTGYLHLGHVVNAVFVWGLARARGGTVILRVEDHDRSRSRPAFEAALVEDLDWLGFAPDEGRHPVRRQSDDDAPYEAALARLAAAGCVYACDCSRRRLGGDPYDGRCRARGLAPRPGLGLRVRLESGEETFVDERLGPQRQTPATQCGDLLARDRNGNWTYQFAVTVDDVRDRITLVTRGEDLLESTGRQIALARLLGRAQPPAWHHHTLLRKPSGDKLSKASSDTGVRELRAAGLAPAAVIGRAVAAAGLQASPAPMGAADVGRLFP